MATTSASVNVVGSETGSVKNSFALQQLKRRRQESARFKQEIEFLSRSIRDLTQFAVLVGKTGARKGSRTTQVIGNAEDENRPRPHEISRKELAMLLSKLILRLQNLKRLHREAQKRPLRKRENPENNGFKQPFKVRSEFSSYLLSMLNEEERSHFPQLQQGYSTSVTLSSIFGFVKKNNRLNQDGLDRLVVLHNQAVGESGKKIVKVDHAIFQKLISFFRIKDDLPERDKAHLQDAATRRALAAERGYARDYSKGQPLGTSRSPVADVVKE